MSAALVAATFALAGCTGAAPHAVRSSSPAHPAALTTAELPALWAAYDADNNAAIAASRYPKSQTKPWSKVDTEMVLDLDVFNTRAQRYLAAQDRSPGKAFYHHGETVYAGGDAGYPRAALVTYVVGGAPAVFDAALAKEERGVALLTKTAADAPWRMAAVAGVLRRDLPAALPAGPRSDPSQRDLESAIAITQAIDAHLAGGAVKGFRNRLDANGGLAQWLSDKAATRKDKDIGVLSVDVHGYGGKGYATGAAGNVRAVRATGGVLVMSSFAVSVSMNVKPGMVAYNDGTYGKMTGQTKNKDQRYLSTENAAVTLAWLPDGGKPQLLSGEITYVAP